MDDLSLAECVVTYEYISRFNNYEENGVMEVYNEENDVIPTKYIHLQDGTRMKQRTRPAVLKTQYYTQISNREALHTFIVAFIVAIFSSSRSFQK